MTTVLQRSQIKSSFTPAAPTGICPFCGNAGTGPDAICNHCGARDSSATRERAKSTVGPWQVLDPNHPAAQGVNFETLRSWINDGKVVATSVVRGPTTAQLWKPAGKVKGLSREFGICYSCDARVDRTAALCPNCNRSQTLPFDPDMLLDASSPVPLPAAASPLSTQTWIEEAPVRSESAATARPARKVFKRDLLLTPGDLAKVFQLDAGPVARIDYRPRRNRRQVLRKIGRRVMLGVLLAGATAIAVDESIATGPLAWQWIQHTLLSQPYRPAVAITAPTAEPVPAPAVSRKAVNAEPSVVASPALVAVAPTVTTHVDAPATVAAARFSPTALEPDPVEPSPEQAIRDLWNQGLAAEAQRHFAVAVDKYEQVVSYPNTYWPATLNVRLGLARQEAVGTR